MLNSKNLTWGVGVILVIIGILPMLFLGTGSYFTIHDNLDSDFLYFHLLAKENLAWSFNLNAVLPNVMNGIPRSAFHSGINVTALLFQLFSSPTAYILNYILVHSIGFFGMYYLLKSHFFKLKEEGNLSLAISFSFSFIPFYTIHGISVAGQPLLLYAFLNLLNEKPKFYNYLIIGFFPAYSFSFLVGPFIIIALIVIGLIYTIKNKRIVYHYFLGLGLLCALYCVVEFELIYSMFLSSDFVSHRTSWAQTMVVNTSFKEFIDKLKSIILSGHYHSGIFKTYIILFCAFAALGVLRKAKKETCPILGILGIIFLICLFHSLYDPIKFYLKDTFPFLYLFNLSRFTFLLPLLWYILFAQCLIIIKTTKIKEKYLLIILLLNALTTISSNQEYKENVRIIFNHPSEERPSVEMFFSQNLFRKIHNKIGLEKKSYRVASVGMHPSIAQYNGFSTLDSYQNNYSMDYKKKFVKIVEEELNKNSKIKNYFYWGSRCYIFSAELGKNFLFPSKTNVAINDLRINSKAFKDMGGLYLFSAVKIRGFSKGKFQLIGEFSEPKAFSKIFLYKVVD